MAKNLTPDELPPLPIAAKRVEYYAREVGEAAKALDHWAREYASAQKEYKEAKSKAMLTARDELQKKWGAERKVLADEINAHVTLQIVNKMFERDLAENMFSAAENAKYSKEAQLSAAQSILGACREQAEREVGFRGPQTDASGRVRA